MGTGLGSDTGFPKLFLDDKYYGYMYWADRNDPPYEWDTKEQACESQVRVTPPARRVQPVPPVPEHQGLLQGAEAPRAMTARP